MESYFEGDVVSITLFGAIALLVGFPALLITIWKLTRPPFGISSFRWVYIAWASMLASSSVWSFEKAVRHSLDQAGSDNFIRLGFLMAGLALLLFIGARYRFAFFSELSSGVFGLFLLFGLWGLATTVWSVSPANTLYKSAEYLAMLAVFALTALLVNRGVRWPENRLIALKSVFDFSWLLIFLLVVSAYMGLLIWPDLALQRDWRDQSGVVGFSLAGVMPGINDNALGQVAAVAGVVALVRMLVRTGSWMIYAPILVASIVTMVLTQSRSPILGFAVAVVIVLLADRRFKLMAVSALIFLGVILSQYGQVIYDFMRRGQSMDLIFSLTGRVTYWESGIEVLRDSPLGGLGANAGGRYVLETVLGNSDTSTVHSTWVEVLIDTGYVGLGIFTVAVIGTIIGLWKYRPGVGDSILLQSLWLEAIGAFTVLFVRSFFAVTLVWSWQLLPFGAVLVYISVMRRERVRVLSKSADASQFLSESRGRGSGLPSRSGTAGVTRASSHKVHGTQRLYRR